MGIFGKAEITIDFNCNLPEVFKNVNALETALEAYAPGHYCIHAVDYNVYERGVELQISSGRVQNMDWQVEQLLEFLKENYLDELEEFNSSGYVEADYGNYNWDRGHLECDDFKTFNEAPYGDD
jgi:hypothetical protein